MKRCIYVVGAPGVGKSTVTGLWLHRLGGIFLPSEPMYVTYYEVKAHPEKPWQRHSLDGHRLIDGSGWVVGKYGTRSSFEGTDALGFSSSTSMARMYEDYHTPARARPYDENLMDAPAPEFVIGEGARMPGTTLATVAQHAELTLVVLTASPETLEARRRERGSDQKESWVVSQTTKVENTARLVGEAGGQVIRIDTESSTCEDIADELALLS